MSFESPIAEHGATHQVLNQVPPYENVNLFEANAALRDAIFVDRHTTGVARQPKW